MVNIFGIDFAYITSLNLLKTKTMKGLQEIAEHDSEWRKIALRITRDKHHADDIVQDMYLKLSDKEDKNITPYYVIMTLESIFKDYHKMQGIQLNYNSNLFEESEHIYNESKFEPTDREQVFIDRAKKLPYIEREILAESYDRSIRHVADTFDMTRMFVHRRLKKAVDEVLGDESHLYENSSLKYLKK